MDKIKKLLVSQPKPQSDKSPYSDLAEKHNLKIDFFKFISIEGVSSKEYRESKTRILDHTGVIFTSKIAIDHFFRICEESRTAIPDSMKYYCMSENIALYLQKYIVYRKRKIFFGQKTINDLINVIKTKHTAGKILLTVSDTPNERISKALDESKVQYAQLAIYHTVSCDLKNDLDIMGEEYDMIVFFTQAGVKALFDNYPDFKQKEIKIAAFGPTTQKAAAEAGLNVDIKTPTPKAPSMTMAIDHYIQDLAKKGK